MGKKLIHLSIDESLLETSDSLKNSVLKDDNLTFFIINTKSQNAWDTFVYQMGLVKIRQDFEKFKRTIDDDDGN